MSKTFFIKKHFQQKQTIVTLISEKNSYINSAIKEIKKRRNEIEQYISKDKFFRITLEPYRCSDDSPEIIKKMCISSEKLNIGPMSTVAGIIAEYAVSAMIEKGAKFAIVDNGGDIALYSNKTINVGIYTGKRFTGKFAFQVLPTEKILGICTSSGLIGPSLSFGNTNSATVISYDLSLADAAATALGNQVNSEEDVKSAFDIFKNVEGIIGASVFIQNKIGLWGSVPRIIPANVSYDLITRGRYYN